MIAAHDLAAGFVRDEPYRSADVLFGADALTNVEARLARHLVSSWEAGRSSLRPPTVRSEPMVACAG